jgi:hypothetical protein
VVDGLDRDGLDRRALSWFDGQDMVKLSDFNRHVPPAAWRSDPPRRPWMDALGAGLAKASAAAISSRLVELGGGTGEDEETNGLVQALRTEIRKANTSSKPTDAAIVAFTLTSKRVNSEEHWTGGDFGIAYFVADGENVYQRMIICQAKTVPRNNSSLRRVPRDDLQTKCALMVDLLPDASFGVYYELTSRTIRADRCVDTKCKPLPSPRAQAFQEVLTNLWSFREGQTMDPSIITRDRDILVVLATR